VTRLPLQGVRILAVEQFGAGPYGSLHLADLGAEVIKIENPAVGGDVSRLTGPHFLGNGDSEFFQTFNVNKKSLALDLKSAAGREVFERLTARADAVMNNLRGDQPARLGLDYASLRAANPKIVCAHLSAYGRDNDRAHWPGYDYLMQAEAGFMLLTGEPDGPPVRFGLSMVDFMTGATTALGLLAALLGAGRSGRGCDVDVSLFDVALHQLSYPATWYLNEGEQTTRLSRSSHPATVPCQLFTAADGWLFVMIMTPRFWSELCAIVKRPDLRDHARFANVEARRANREHLTQELDAVFATATVAEWLERLKGRIPVAPVHDLKQALDNAYLEDIGMIRKVPHPLRPDLRVLSNPIKIDGQRLSARACGPLGTDTDEVLRSAGYSDEQIGTLRADKVING